MKRIFLIAAVTALIFTTESCGGNETEEETTETSVESDDSESSSSSSNPMNSIINNVVDEVNDEIQHQVSDPNSEFLESIDTIKEVIQDKVVEPVTNAVNDKKRKD